MDKLADWSLVFTTKIVRANYEADLAADDSPGSEVGESPAMTEIDGTPDILAYYGGAVPTASSARLTDAQSMAATEESPDIVDAKDLEAPYPWSIHDMRYDGRV